jgi:hypothetical protein
VAKNMGGIDASLNCLQSSEGHSLPRKLEVQTPLVPGDADDHFPEHKGLPGDEYANGQVGGAALWQVLEGMRSKCGLCGPLQFGVRFLSALKQTGFFGFEPGFTDTGIYQLLYDLEARMANQWAASPGNVTTERLATVAELLARFGNRPQADALFVKALGPPDLSPGQRYALLRRRAELGECLRVRAASSPSSTSRWRVRATVSALVSSAAAIWWTDHAAQLGRIDHEG